MMGIAAALQESNMLKRRLVRWLVLLAKGHGHHDLPSHLGPHGVQDEDMGELWVLCKEALRI